jgi:hypothetical protein
MFYAVVALHFRDAKGGKDAQLLQRTASCIDLNDNIWRWVRLEIEILLMEDAINVAHVVTLIPFRAFFARARFFYVAQPNDSTVKPFASQNASTNASIRRAYFSWPVRGLMISSVPPT